VDAINPAASHGLVAASGNRTRGCGCHGWVVYGSSVENERRVITAAEMDRMTPQARADAVDASIVRSWDKVSPQFRARIIQRAAELSTSFGL
jgi:hypothetical protein